LVLDADPGKFLSNDKGVINFHLKVMMIRKRDISVDERREMVTTAVSGFRLEAGETKALIQNATKGKTERHPGRTETVLGPKKGTG
jgi:hypothetical protein